MKARKTLLAASATLALVSFQAVAAESAGRLLQLAQASDAAAPEAVVIAEQAVEAARAALRAAIAAGDGVEEARQNLRLALQALDAARTAAGLPLVVDPQDLELLPPEGEVPAVVPPVETPPVVEEPPPPPAVEPPPVVEEPPVPPVEPPPVVEEPPPPPPPAEPPPVVEEPPPVPPVAEEAPVVVPPVEPPVVAPPVVELPADEVVPPPQPPAPAPDAAPVAVELPPPVVEEPPPPPPPAAMEGAFDLKKFKDRPKFGQAPVAEPAAPPPELQQTEAAVKEGAVINAPDGRIIIKQGGQVTVLHDDGGRLRQRGDKFDRRPSDNDTETTTITRPDGTEIVTVRDRFGNIVQRYRKNRDGTIQVMIGDVEQPGFVGRIFGRGPTLPPPRPRRPSLNLQLGPVAITIPQQEYILESSNADEEEMYAALMAPPVETVERGYTLEEIRRSGRLRDKVRRIDFDTITFDTAQATVPDTQIPTLEAVGEAIRKIIERDPTQVFLIEGHTDAVGSDLYNLSLSDRRAETVAEILSYYYAIPPENLVTQGYGEQFLKIPTVGAERENRRVAFRNITNLLHASNQ